MPHYRPHHDPRSSHQQILAHVLRLRAEPVLDVGAAQGILGRMAQSSGLAIDAVEPHADWADEARPFYRQVFASGIEAAPLPQGKYRTVVCGDVLEHTVDPVAVLRRLAEAATNDAAFIISVPNAAHISVRLLLLIGRFPRMERGILDRTHLHYFTRDTAVQMLREAGLTPEKVSATPVPLDEIWRNADSRWWYRILVRCQHLAVQFAPRLFGFQWVMLARRGTYQDNGQ